MPSYLDDYQLEVGRALGRKHTCRDKVDYKSRYLAELKAAELSPNARHELEAYPCPFCHGWHIGGRLSEQDAARALERAKLLGYPN